MAFLYKGTVCTEVTVHITISTGQTAAPDDAEAAPNCCFITQRKKRKEKKKRTSSLLKPRIFKDICDSGSGEMTRSRSKAPGQRRYDAGWGRCGLSVACKQRAYVWACVRLRGVMWKKAWVSVQELKHTASGHDSSPSIALGCTLLRWWNRNICNTIFYLFSNIF